MLVSDLRSKVTSSQSVRLTPCTMLPSMQFTNPSGLMICPQSCATVNLRAQILLVLTSLKQRPDQRPQGTCVEEELRDAQPGRKNCCWTLGGRRNRGFFFNSGRRAGKALEARPDQCQVRRRYFPHGVDPRFREKTGSQDRDFPVQ